MGRKEDNIKKAQALMRQTKFIRNIGTAAHIDHGKTTLSDNLIAGSGMMSEDLAGVIILVCAVEGVMPQTETVIRQAIKERVHPILFINKVDRLINELKVTPEQMQERLAAIMNEVHLKVQNLLPPELKEKWALNVSTGNIILGSAFNNWAISVPYMKKTNITFKDIYEYCKNGDQKTLSKRAPLHEVLLEEVIMHLPNPADAVLAVLVYVLES